MNEEKIIEARKMLCQHLRELAKEKNISQDEIAEKTASQLDSYPEYGIKHFADLKEILDNTEAGYKQ